MNVARTPSPVPMPETAIVRTACETVRQLHEDGHSAWIVGGAVRNALLGRPVDDVDIATSALPDRVARLFPGAKGVGAHFGVMLVPMGGHVFEVATFRAEGAYVDRRHPEAVRFGTLEEDWPRRDFTVNAMYYDPIRSLLIDPADGRADLERRLLRTVGPPRLRFEEDALRLLRAVRFAARCELEIEPATADAIRSEAGGLAQIAIERVAEELTRILTGPHRGRAMHWMAALGLWPHVIPEIVPMYGCEQPPAFHPEGDVFVHTALVLDALDRAWEGEPPAELACAALLHDVGKPPTAMRDETGMRFPEHQRVGAEMADAICQRLRLATRQRQQVAELVAHHMRFQDVTKMKRARLHRFLARPDFDLHLALHKADCLGCHGRLEHYEFCVDERERMRAEHEAASLLPPSLLTGRDLIALGMKPGPSFAPLLEAVRDEQLEGRLLTREQALDWIKQHEGGADL